MRASVDSAVGHEHRFKAVNNNLRDCDDNFSNMIKLAGNAESFFLGINWKG